MAASSQCFARPSPVLCHSARSSAVRVKLVCVSSGGTNSRNGKYSITKPASSKQAIPASRTSARGSTRRLAVSTEDAAVLRRKEFNAEIDKNLAISVAGMLATGFFVYLSFM